MRLHIKCPNCAKPAKAYRTRQMSEVVTEVAYNCHNPACGSNFVVTAEVSRYLRLPTFINPRVNVPLSPIIQRRQITEAIERLQTAQLPDVGEIVCPSEGTRQRDIFDEVPLMAHSP